MNDSTTAQIKKMVQNQSEFIGKRVNSLFLAREIGGIEGLDILQSALYDPSSLLAHEAAYLIGQLALKSSMPMLIEVLTNRELDSIVRHEAAEALAAIGDPSCSAVLRKFLSDESHEVSQTCYLALRSLEEKNSRMNNGGINLASQEPNPLHIQCHTVPSFCTIDPVSSISKEIKAMEPYNLGQVLMNSQEDLYTRYQALFELRNRNQISAHLLIISALVDDKSSALLRHEIAFVLGQLQLLESFNTLCKCLSNDLEHSMARHEAALAIAAVTMVHQSCKDEAIKILNFYSKHHSKLVAESCFVALSNIQECYSSSNN